MIIQPSYLIEQLKAKEQWKRILYVFMRTWDTLCIHDDFWIFYKNKIKVVFNWNSKKFHFFKENI